jgi:hypothetical protein
MTIVSALLGYDDNDQPFLVVVNGDDEAQHLQSGDDSFEQTKSELIEQHPGGLEENGSVNSIMQPVRNLFGPVRLKSRPFGIKIQSMVLTGSMFIPACGRATVMTGLLLFFVAWPHAFLLFLRHRVLWDIRGYSWPGDLVESVAYPLSNGQGDRSLLLKQEGQHVSHIVEHRSLPFTLSEHNEREHTVSIHDCEVAGRCSCSKACRASSQNGEETTMARRGDERLTIIHLDKQELTEEDVVKRIQS